MDASPQERAGAGGALNRDVAKRLQVTPRTVGKWRQRFVDLRLDGLLDAPRPGQPRKISDAKVEEIIALTLESRPADATHWSTRQMAKVASLNQTAVTRIWRAFGLQPHRQETFKLSTDPLFIDKVRDIVGLYLAPPARAVVLCVDRNRRFRRWTARSRFCRCRLAWPSGAAMTMCGMVRPRCSPHWIWPPAKSWANCIGVIVLRSS